MKVSRYLLVLAAALTIAVPGFGQSAQHVPASSIPPADLIQPADLAAALQSKGSKPLILQVGSRVMFTQAHIPDAEYAGPAGKEDGLQTLKERIASLPKSAPVVLYCGCCPWGRCPNIAPAYNLLHEQGFTHLKVLYIADDFGTDWVTKGYPVDKGQ